MEMDRPPCRPVYLARPARPGSDRGQPPGRGGENRKPLTPAPASVVGLTKSNQDTGTPNRLPGGDSMRTHSLRTTLVVSFVMLLAVPLLAQSQFAGLTGTVISKDGNPLPKVELVATNQATQVTYTGRSNDAGLYTISALPIGTYKLRAQAPSFQTYETNPIKLESGQTARVDITMQVGGVTENVEVTGVALGHHHPGDAPQRAQLRPALPPPARCHHDGAGQLHPAQELRFRAAVRERPARAGEQLHARRHRHERADRQPAALPAQPGRPGRGPRRDQQLQRGVRQRGGRDRRQHDQVRHQRVPRQRLRVLARQQPGRELLGQQPRHSRRGQGRAVPAHLRGHPRRSHHQEQGVLLRRLPGVHPQPAGRAGAERGPGGLSQRGLLGGGGDHPRPAHRAALPREHHPDQPLQSDRAGRARQPDPLSSSQPVRKHEQPRRPLLGQAADAPGRRQGRREPLRQGPHLRPRVLPALHFSAGAGTLAEPTDRHEQRTFPGHRLQLDAHPGLERAQRAAAGLQPREVPDHPHGLGGHRQRQRQHRHPRQPAHPRAQRLQHRRRPGVRQRRQLRVQRHQVLPVDGEVHALPGPPLLQVRGALALPAAGLRLCRQRGGPRPLRLHRGLHRLRLRRLPPRPGFGQGPGRVGAAVHAPGPPHRHLRPGRLARPQRPHSEPRHHLGVPLAVGGEGQPPVQHRPQYRATHPGRPERPQPGALQLVQGRLRAARGLRLDAGPEAGGAGSVRDRAVHGGHGQEPPAHPEPAVQLRRPQGLRRHHRARHRRHRVWRHHPAGERWPRHVVSHLRPRPETPAHQTMERLRGEAAQQLRFRAGRLRGKPLDPHGGPVRLQPASPRYGPSVHLGPHRPAPAPLHEEPFHRRHQRHQLDRRRRLRRPAGEPEAASHGRPRVHRVLHLQQGAE
ncbi:MAG: hypothetical protein DMF77_15560 [Acidobacteria bacterium]|nr:MAG: hypothetical protein DMF77_15560 [Acidobacteriota bacterium]